jgi:hypothetical protein
VSSFYHIRLGSSKPMSDLGLRVSVVGVDGPSGAP